MFTSTLVVKSHMKFSPDRDRTVKTAINNLLSNAVKELQQECANITESDKSVHSESLYAQKLLCVLESAFIHGLKVNFYEKKKYSRELPNPQFWSLLVKLSHKDTVDQTCRLKLIKTQVGRSRAWIRLSLNDGALSSYLSALLHNSEHRSLLNRYYDSFALFQDSEQADIFLRYLQGAETLEFGLSCNSSVLNAWTRSPLELAHIILPKSARMLAFERKAGDDDDEIVMTSPFDTSPRRASLTRRNSSVDVTTAQRPTSAASSGGIPRNASLLSLPMPLSSSPAYSTLTSHMFSSVPVARKSNGNSPTYSTLTSHMLSSVPVARKSNGNSVRDNKNLYEVDPVLGITPSHPVTDTTKATSEAPAPVSSPPGASILHRRHLIKRKGRSRRVSSAELGSSELDSWGSVNSLSSNLSVHSMPLQRSRGFSRHNKSATRHSRASSVSSNCLSSSGRSSPTEPTLHEHEGDDIQPPTTHHPSTSIHKSASWHERPPTQQLQQQSSPRRINNTVDSKRHDGTGGRGANGVKSSAPPDTAAIHEEDMTSLPVVEAAAGKDLAVASDVMIRSTSTVTYETVQASSAGGGDDDDVTDDVTTTTSSGGGDEESEEQEQEEEEVIDIYARRVYSDDDDAPQRTPCGLTPATPGAYGNSLLCGMGWSSERHAMCSDPRCAETTTACHVTCSDPACDAKECAEEECSPVTSPPPVPHHHHHHHHHRGSGGTTADSPDPSPVVCREGFLQKKSENIISLWRTRWFVLDRDSLSYYKDKKSTKALGSISLSHIALIHRDDIDKLKILTLKMSDESQHQLASDDRSVLHDWSDDIDRAARLRHEHDVTVDNDDFEVLDGCDVTRVSSAGSLLGESRISRWMDDMRGHVTRIANEKGLDAQNYQCADCASPIGIIYGAPRLCDFTGQYYCAQCHVNDLHVIPARMIHNWDFSKHKIAKRSKRFLTRNWRDPCIKVNEVNPGAYRHLSQVRRLLSLRLRLVALTPYLNTCRLLKRDQLDSKLRGHYYMLDDAHTYTPHDLHLSQDGTLHDVIARVVTYGTQHVRQCALCTAKGFVCEICRSDEIIFPFDDDDVTYQCDDCRGVFHKNCLPDPSDCPRCKRRVERFRKEEEPLFDDDDDDSP